MVRTPLKFLYPHRDADHNRTHLLLVTHLKISSRFVHNFLSYPADRQTNTHTKEKT